jgi:hypothetical protein
VKGLWPCLLGMATATAAAGEDTAWRSSWDAALYTTVTRTGLPADSLLNPANRYAHLAEATQGDEARFNFKLEADALRLTLRPILSWHRQNDGTTSAETQRGYLSQW